MTKKIVLSLLVLNLAIIGVAGAQTIEAAALEKSEWPVIDLAPNAEMILGADPALTIFDVAKLPGAPAAENSHGTEALGLAQGSPAAQGPRFEPVGKNVVWTGKSKPATWIRFSIPSLAELNGKLPGDAQIAKNAQSAQPGQPAQPGISQTIQAVQSLQSAKMSPEWMLVVRPSFSIILDYVDLYVPSRDGGYEHFSSGAKVSARPLEPKSRFFVFQLPAEAFGGAPCYLRISSTTDVEVGLTLETGVGFFQNETREYVAYGLLYGILVAMILYSVFLLFSLKDRAYLYYILYMVSAGLWIFFVQGHAKLIFGQKPQFDQTMLWFWVGAMITWGAMFTENFLKLKDGSRGLFYLFAVIAVLGAAVSVGALFGLNDMAFVVSHYLGVVLPVLVIVAAVVRIVQRLPSAIYFLIAWFFLALGDLSFSLMGLKILPVTFWTTNGMALGMGAQSIFLSMALTDRLRQLEAEKERLESTQSHYLELSLTDPLTGLRNKRFLTTELDLAVLGAHHTKSSLALMLLDLDDFKRVNDTMGHNVGDAVLATLARSMRSCTRESDSLCRFGGDEFVIVLPGVTEIAAFNVAERIRNRFHSDWLESSGEKEEQGCVSVSIGVVRLCDNETAQALLTRADAAMYEAKRLGKNRSVLK
ncbi:MAG TPA: diguanylate cyclase [Spirochaetales bacterium]|nr:diguanylate cyclase [Spirochaetales bacterium]